MSMNIIYVDVLIILNIYVTYFLIKATARFTHSSLKISRLVISSVVGSLFSLIIFIPDINYILMFLIKSAASFIIVFIGFNKTSFHNFIKLVVYFYVINFAFAGIIMGMKYLLNTRYICVNNTFMYIDFSTLNLVVFTAVSYFVICGVRFLIDRNTCSDGNYNVIIKNNNKIISLDGLADTGNSLTDVFSGRPVIVCPEKIINELLEPSDNCSDIYQRLTDTGSIKGVRLIPYSTIDGCSTIPAFIPDEIIIKKNKSCKTVDALIAVKRQEISAIFNPKILI